VVEAIGECEMAVHFDPKSAAAHYCLAYSLEEQGEGERSQQEFRLAYSLDPRDPGIRGEFQRRRRFGYD
jgi:Tfp pilus assembly protein PilF